ncbi:type IV conjugative transfer system protein TraE (plasmid) [Bermanella marisrubri]|uniref:Plasmid-like conjugative transfer protein TraE n=1 Tax=Bermanella marisrubri TaxID=207949 RepID=Q1MXI2_9GAMM|nr:type IV conjugative transfer system protein TraE [Bermanella marisrubri]EAT10690.1 plasmid-like conjugative transfer protein TraE [Oceanobacter sp. RED65] [Bermanella marisrubri]QIZ85906.1 type IV conjugative transfer system protein TraE [Bermanella marisrubri]
MNRDVYKSVIAQMNVSRLFWASLSSLLIVSNVLLAYFVVTADTSEKTTLVPIGFESEFWVHNEEVDPEYLEQMSLFFLDLYTDYHPSNVESRFKMILKYVEPSAHGLLERRFDSEAQRIRNSSLSSTFHPSAIKIRETTVFVHGILQGLVAGKATDPDLDAVFRIDFEHDHGRLFIKTIERVIETQSGEYLAYE